MAYRPDQKAKPEPKPKTPDDVWLDILREDCARAMVKAIRGSINPDRSIRSLKYPEVLAISDAVWSQWIVSVSKRMAEDRKSVPAEYVNLLMG